MNGGSRLVRQKVRNEERKMTETNMIYRADLLTTGEAEKPNFNSKKKEINSSIFHPRLCFIITRSLELL